ncbi:MAG: SLC13 family permease [Pseudomonadota bacterium]
MTFDQGIIFAVLACAMVLFAWGKWRYDVVAVLALLVVVFAGVVPAHDAFMGFGHPAVITVAAVLIISRALKISGVVELLVGLLSRSRNRPSSQIAATGSMAAVLSAFMNNVGALALMLPVALRNAALSKEPPSRILMPLSFATLLGGLVTLIGTPPNIIIASFRESAEGAAFSMFDFTPVGLAVAVAGMLFISLVGWRLLPANRRSNPDDHDRFEIEAYIIEARVPEKSDLVGKQIRALEHLCDNEVSLMMTIRGERRRFAPAGTERLRAGDILILEGDPTALNPLFAENKLEVSREPHLSVEDLESEEIELVEAVVMPLSLIEGRSMRGMKMHERYGINLLAIARQGQAPKTRLGSIRFKTGDILLLQGERQSLKEVLSNLGCLPLAERGISLAPPKKSLLPAAIFALAIGAAALGLVQVQIAFVAAVVALLICNCLSMRDVYDAVEWPVIVLLGALLPIGEALQSTGGTALIAGGITELAGEIPIWALLTLLLVVSMLLSDLVHNSPTAVLMAPIAISIAKGLGLPADPFLMAVAVGSASPYLTPIGHQSNTLVMGPGGYHFADYWRMGLPLDAIIVAVAIPMIMWVWMP